MYNINSLALKTFPYLDCRISAELWHILFGGSTAVYFWGLFESLLWKTSRTVAEIRFESLCFIGKCPMSFQAKLSGGSQNNSL